MSERNNLPVQRGWGGRRVNSGRPRRSPATLVEQLRHEAIELRRKYKTLPLTYLLNVLNDETSTPEQKMEAARISSGFLHARLAAVEITRADVPPETKVLDLTKLSDEELVEFQRLLEKVKLVEQEPSSTSLA